MFMSSFIFHSGALRPTATSTKRVHRRPMVCKMVPPTEDYRHAEMLDDAEASANMAVWNAVIHASLKRKLEGLVAEHPVANGVSAMLHTAPGHTASTREFDSGHPPSGMSPSQVVSYTLAAFKRDALAGAAAFSSVASSNCHVKFTSPQTLVLFIGDNESYRPLLRVTSFFCASPRFEAGGEKCVVAAEIHTPSVGEDGSAKFDFQLSIDESGAWLIDEVFRL